MSNLTRMVQEKEINALLAGTADAEIKAKYADVIDQLPAMKELYGHRARLRKERGCMDIESGEVKLILDENGRCIDVKKRTSGESESMIEEFMLLANQCAAHFARVKQIPFVYRVHEEPNAEAGASPRPAAGLRHQRPLRQGGAHAQGAERHPRGVRGHAV